MYPSNPFAPGYFNGNIANTYAPALPVQQPSAPVMEIQKVNGEESAKAFPMGPNSSVILLDSNEPLIWVVTTDASGFKTVMPFSIAYCNRDEPVKQSDLDTKLESINERLTKLEERMNTNEQSNHESNWKAKSGNANNQPNAKYGQSSKGPAGGNGTAHAE